MGEAMKYTLPEAVRSTVFKESERLDGASPKIEGYDFNKGVNYHELFKSMAVTGFQASNLGDAIQLVNEMLDWRLSDETPAEDCSEEERDVTYRESVRCKVFLGFTSNLISSGIRDIVRYLLQHRMVDAVVTTAGGVEEDLVKCLAPTFRGDFSLPGSVLRSKGLNRIGNLLVPNDNYCKFEDWIIPIFDQMLEEQKSQNILWTPSEVIARLGKEINNETSLPPPRTLSNQDLHSPPRPDPWPWSTPPSHREDQVTPMPWSNTNLHPEKTKHSQIQHRKENLTSKATYENNSLTKLPQQISPTLGNAEAVQNEFRTNATERS
ncbi:deoxyhypusine synthase [Phtheirospermum japonicum]|uniref:Deoxyhypusine synthase n=1 Tax=Phtheirospermum japonicum TaxID=374723 RepID=A0A830D0C3_9LAMI|nr:deoxyhypusine synthase [Phtheirospermum japonicum]